MEKIVGHLERMKEIARGRADLYRFLGGLYLRPPEPDSIRKLADEAFLDDLSSAVGAEGVQTLKQCAGGGPGDRPDEQALRQEFMRLFVVPLDRYVTPYESVYRDDSPRKGERLGGLLMGRPALDVQRAYERAGVDLSKGPAELPDHIGVELAFMAFLCAREDEAWRKGEDSAARSWIAEQERFLSDHLLGWFPRLRTRVRECTESSFFRGVVDLTVAFLEEDHETLSRSIDGLRPGEADVA